MAMFEIRSGRNLDGASQGTLDHLNGVFLQIIERSGSSEARTIAVEGLYKINNPDGPPQRSEGMLASISHYFNTSVRKEVSNKVQDLDRVDRMIVMGSKEAEKTYNIDADHYNSLSASFAVDADPIIIAGEKLSEIQRVEMLSRLIKHEIESNRWIPKAGQTKPFFREILKQVILRSNTEAARAAAAQELCQLAH
jgi:hypothetical protein